MKKNSKIKFVAASLVLAAGLFIAYSLADCGACLTEQDYKFLEKVESAVVEVGDEVKVSEVYPGEWSKVCAIGYGYNLNIINHFSKEYENVRVRNDAYYYISDKYDDSALVFVYEPNEIEIFRMVPEEITYATYEENDCLSKEDAYFFLRTDNPGNKSLMLTTEQET